MQRASRFLAFCSLLPWSAAGAGTHFVEPGSPLPSIQVAIDLALPGDSIVVRPGIYYEKLVLRDGILVLAQADGSVVVDAQQSGPVVTAAGVGRSTTVRGLWLQGGAARAGGGLYAVSSDAAFVGCVFYANSALLGGGAYLRDGSAATFTDCTFSNNTATVGGGLYLDFAAVHLDSCLISGNQAADGGALSANNAAEALVEFCTLHANRTRTGAAVACNSASPTFVECTVAANQDDAGGGAFGLRGSAARLERCIVALNSGPALVSISFSSPWIGCCDFFGNSSQTLGSGDQGDNLFVDPLFCDAGAHDFRLRVDSPLLGAACGRLGSQAANCPGAYSIAPARTLAWSSFKNLYR